MSKYFTGQVLDQVLDQYLSKYFGEGDTVDGTLHLLTKDLFYCRKRVKFHLIWPPSDSVDASEPPVSATSTDSAYLSRLSHR